MKQFKFGDRVRSIGIGDAGTYIEATSFASHRVYMDHGAIWTIGDANIAPEFADAPPGAARVGRSRVAQSKADRTALDHRAAAGILDGMLAMDGEADPRRIAEIICERVAERHIDTYADSSYSRRMDRLTDHIASVVATIMVILETRDAAENATAVVARPSDHEGNGWDDIDTTCEGAML